MAISEEIRLLIKAESSKALAELKKLEGQVKKVDKSTSELRKAYDGVQKAMGAAAVVAGTLYTVYTKLIAPASALEETNNKFNESFKETASSAKAWADTLVESYAMSRRESMDTLASFNSLLKPMTRQPELAASMSMSFSKLAADLASYNNMNTADVVRDLNSALTGSSETVEKYGANVKVAKVQQEAFNLGLWDGKSALTDSARAQAILSIVTRETTDAKNDMINTADSFANVMKKANANMEDAGAIIGGELLGPLKDLIKEFTELDEEGRSTLKTLGQFIAVILRTIKVLISLSDVILAANPFQLMKDAIAGNLGDVDLITKRIDKLKTDFGKMSDSLVKLASEDGGTEDRAAAMQKEQEALAAYNGQKEQNFKDEMKRVEESKKARADALNFLNQLRLTDTENELLQLEEKYLGIREQKVLNDEEMLMLEEEYQARRQEVIFESNLKVANQTIQATATVMDSIKSIIQQDSKNRQMKLDADYNKEKQKIMKNITDEEERKKALEKLDEKFSKKKSELRKKEAKKAKAMAIAMAVINTAQGVTAALASPGGIAGIVLAAIVAALGIVQIGLIAAEPIAAESGALIKGSIDGTLMRAGEKGKTEAIVPFENEEVQDRMGGLFGGGGNQEPQTVININNFYALGDAQEMAQMIDRELYKLKQDQNSAFASSILEG